MKTTINPLQNFINPYTTYQIQRHKKQVTAKFVHSLLVGLFLIALSNLGHGQVWSGGGGDDNWTTGANWVGGVAPANSEFTTEVQISGNFKPDSVVNVPYTIETLSYTPGGTTSYTLSGSELSVGGFGGSTSTDGISNSAQGRVTIDNNINVLRDQAFENSGGGLTLNGNIDGGISTRFFEFSNNSVTGANMIVNGSITKGSTGFDGSAPIVLSGDNHAAIGNLFSGLLELDSNQALPSAGQFYIGATSSSLTKSIVTGGAYTIGTSINVGVSGGGFTLGGNTADKSTYSGDVTLGMGTIFTPIPTHTAQPINLTAAMGGTVTFTGNILHDNAATGLIGLDSVTKVGNGTVILAGSGNTYQGATNINAGALFVTGHSTNGGPYTVAGGAILGGPGGTISTANANVTLDAGSTLAVSGAGLPFALSPGVLTLNLGVGALDIRQAVSNVLPGPPVLSFALRSPVTSDEIAMGAGSLVDIGSGLLAFNKTAFIAGSGFGPGTYTLIDTASPTGIVGSLASSGLSGNVDGFTATLAISTDSLGNQDLVLEVVPEPSQWTLLLIGILVLGVVKRKGLVKTAKFS
jgi:autotransporter-associated beta strand protein